MRAMQVVELGKPLELAEAPKPVPGQGEVLVRVRACGINFADTLMVKGRYQEKFPLPFSPGLEICGTVEAAGPGADGGLVGRRIACYSGVGGLAEYLCVPAERCVPAPAQMPDAEVAGFLIAYGTSHVALDHRAGLKPGERLLVLGASGGVGLTAVEIGRVMGAEVIAVARGAEKCAVAKAAGAHHVFDNDADIRTEVKALGGADVVYDPVGGDLFEAALRACNPLARILPLGFASGDIPQIPANIILVKNITVHGLYWGAYAKLAPHVLAESFGKLFKMYEAGKLRPHVSHVVPLERAEEALDLLRNRAATGKVVVEID
ncbi:NADPH:quinone oxidoreductase family protein [Amaricoccus macauensis]|uniref:NADPH:quinone oxidoreductase family protein n=1 Tax=Amaricoccus macauensis TaxID=57001 RepID=UPI003C7A8CCA